MVKIVKANSAEALVEQLAKTPKAKQAIVHKLFFLNFIFLSPLYTKILEKRDF